VLSTSTSVARGAPRVLRVLRRGRHYVHLRIVAAHGEL